ncbi:MAG: ZIP family metal transporter [Bacteroidetes bacterium]|nr:ZIP family metal transporter [Bacteroidota bacterium]
MPVFSYFLLWFTVVVSGGSVFFFSGIKKQALKLLLAFSGAYLFAICVLHLIPEVYSAHTNNIGVYILVGFFLQIMLEIFSEGIEHGHIHIHKHQHKGFPFALMIGLCVHSFLEGMPLVQNFHDDKTRNSLLAGIILHHIPVAIALTSMLLDSGIKKYSALFYLILFACMAPLGAVISNMISENSISNMSTYFDQIMAIVIGIFLHISTTILFETSEEHRFNYYKIFIILLGAGLALATS